MLVLSSPAIYTLELTGACNHLCVGCSNVYAAARAPMPLPAAVWEQWLENIGPDAVWIRLSGGEPTLHPEFERILAAATSYDALVTVFTNGRWRSPRELMATLQQRPKLAGLLVSLHGASAATHEAFTGVSGAFDETLANIRLALDHGLTVALSTVLTRHNVDEIDALVELGRRLGVQHVAFNRYIGRSLPELEPTPLQLKQALRHIEKLIQRGAPVIHGICVPQCSIHGNGSEGCLAGVAYASIDPWGNVHPCHHSPTVIGSLHHTSIAALWHSDAMEAWRRLMPQSCTTCAAYAVCHGGCRAVQELREDNADPLRVRSLGKHRTSHRTHSFPAQGRPLANVRLRQEGFGYAVLGAGQVLPVRAEAKDLIDACDGKVTFQELHVRFGNSGLDLLVDLWDVGMIEIL
jgi:radical SAM protein with 4Fe4S-binding SPASM domain